MISNIKEKFEDKVVLITGASSGIGEELALQTAGYGAIVVLTARRTERLEEVATRCREKGARDTQVITADVGSRSECERIISETLAAHDRLDVLINNAGYSVSSELKDLDDIELFENVMDVNFRGAMWLTKAALPALLESKGAVCGISSVAGFFSMRGSSIYNASKFAMRGFFDALRQELQPEGVSVTMIYPGYVVTEFKAHVQDESGEERGREALSFYRKHMMSARRCAHITLRAIAAGKRQKLLIASAHIARWVQLIFPGLIEWVTRKISKKKDNNQE